MRASKNIFLEAALPAGIICFLIYLRTLDCEFVLWDDTGFVSNNAIIRKFNSDLFIWSFTTVAPFSGIWIPLVWISFALDYQIWGLNPLGYHLTNIILHSINVMIVVLIADAISRGIFKEHKVPDRTVTAALILAGLLFGIHPLRVESVAWVTERKDVLNGFFSFGSMLFYLKYVMTKEESADGNSSRHYLLSLSCFLFSLMAKPVSVVIPVMLIVADWYLERHKVYGFKALCREKAPFFVIASSVVVMTLYFASGSLLVPMANFPLLERVVVSGNAIFQYVRLFLIPVGIIQYDPLPNPIPNTYLFTSLIVAVTGVAVFWSRKRALIAVTCCFFLPLIPTLALFQNNDHAYAARYTYLPAVVPSVALVVAAVLVGRKLSSVYGYWKKWLVASATVVLFLFYAFMTDKLIGVWRNTGTFWSRIIEVTPMGRAYQERGMYYYGKGEYALAIDDLTKAINIANSLGMFDRYNLNAFRGEACRKVRRYDEAVRDFTFAISKAPRGEYFYLRGLALKALGRIGEADEDFKRAVTAKGSLEWY